MSVEEIGSQLKAMVPHQMKNPLEEHMTEDEFEKFSFLQFAMDFTRDSITIIAQKHPILLVDPKEGFWISDAPVVLHNERQFGPYGNLGLAVSGIEIYLPISPRLALAFFCPSIITTGESKIQDSEKEIKQYFVEQFKSGGLSEFDRLNLADFRYKLERAKEKHRRISIDRKVIVDDHNVAFCNSLQVLNAERFIVSRDGDFKMAKEMIKARPGIQGKGFRMTMR